MADTTALSVNRFSNPRLIAQALMKDPGFQQAPPDVQQAIAQTAQTGQSPVPWAQVMQSAQAAGLQYSNSPWWAGLLAMGSLMAGGAIAGAAAGGGTGAATSSYGPLAGGYGAATTEAAVPASLAATGGPTLASIGAPATITGLTTPGVGAVATSPGVVATTAGAGAAPSLWRQILGSNADIARTAISGVGNLIQSRQVSNAVQAQTEAANRALELQRNIYQQQRTDLAPFADVGRGAISDLARMTGTTPAASTTLPAFQAPAPNVAPTMTGPQGSPAPHDGNPNNAPVVGQAMPRTLATLGGDGLVNMLSPDGRPARVPQAQVQQALAAGGRMA